MNITADVWFAIIAFLASLINYFWGDSEKYLRFFSLFLLVTVLIELIASWLVTVGKENAGLYNVFSIFNFCFYFFILRAIIQKKFVKKTILCVLVIFPILSTWNILFVQKINVFNSMTFSIGSLLVVAMCVYYYVELFRLPYAVNLLREPAFWICSGLLFSLFVHFHSSG